MLNLKTTDGVNVALEPDFIESVDEYGVETCVVRMASGSHYTIDRTQAYVLGVIRAHYERRNARVTC